MASRHLASILTRQSLLAAGRAAVSRTARTMSVGADILYDVLGKELAAIQEAGTYKRERVITTEQAAEIRVAGGAGARRARPPARRCGWAHRHAVSSAAAQVRR